MTASRPTQDELEKPAKGYQFQELSNKLDEFMTRTTESQSEIKQMIAAQNNTYPTRTEIALEFEKRDNKIADLQKTLKTYNRVVWAAWSAIIPIVVAIVWNVIVNNARIDR